MADSKRERLITLLEYLITPENEKEKQLFKEKGLVDDYIAIKNEIPNMDENDLVAAINKQLKPFDLEIDEVL